MDNSIYAFPGTSIEQPSKAKLEALVALVIIIQIFNNYPDFHSGTRKRYPDFHTYFTIMSIFIMI